jgi:hypothetical protein
MLFLAGSTTNERGVEDVIRGQKANLTLGGGRLQIAPERPFADELDARDETPPDAGESHVKHMRNFLESIRANVPANCNEDLGVRVQTIVSMAEMPIASAGLSGSMSARERLCDESRQPPASRYRF